MDGSGRPPGFPEKDMGTLLALLLSSSCAHARQCQ